MNRDFATCSTYPSAIIVPAIVDDEALRKIARFRQGGRFPVLSYYHKKNQTVSAIPFLLQLPSWHHSRTQAGDLSAQQLGHYIYVGASLEAQNHLTAKTIHQEGSKCSHFWGGTVCYAARCDSITSQPTKQQRKPSPSRWTRRQSQTTGSHPALTTLTL